ncbi:MAG: protein kinase [Rhabdochlamydiaceae bacterium]
MELAHFRLLKSLGKGGMGEVFLAYDGVCKREIALKKIRDDLLKYKTIHNRFLREARIAASLTHPSIIPIFSIHEDEKLTYYTMPYIEGKTLKKLLSKSEDASISSLMRIFLSVSQAIAYCHSKKVLHRDLKPENIIVGKFGEVLLIDWGLAELMDEQEKEGDEDIPEIPSLTRPGKVVGTLQYLAPERILGEDASEKADIYALGVILYQLLTLRLPFKRIDLASSQKTVQFEHFIDPREMAPYREIPPQLAMIAKKALEPSKEMRYQYVKEMIVDLESYIEGNPEWLFIEELSIDNKECWEFQENILLAKHIAITRSTEVMEWVSLMVSKNSFGGNMKMEVAIKLGPLGSGIGLLVNVPTPTERKELIDGYCLWIGSEENPGLKLFCSNIEVAYIPHITLKRNEFQTIQVEKTENHLRFFLNEELVCNYTSHSPLRGSHIGLLYRDADFDLQHLKVFIGSHNLNVSCLAVPDALLASKNFVGALSEYRRIAHSFPGRIEGREAIFRAGTTLLENASTSKKLQLKKQLFSLALEEFGKLHGAAGAPLEYLGKSLVYKAIGETSEEIKCLELAIRKYAKHPLLPRLIEHIIFRLHEASKYNRLAAYHLALLTLRFLPQIFDNPDNRKLMCSLEEHWESLDFLSTKDAIIHLSFVLGKPLPLLESIESGKNVEDALFALLNLGCIKILKENSAAKKNQEIQQALALQYDSPSTRVREYIFKTALDEGKAKEILPFAHTCNLLHIRALLSLRKWQEAGALLDAYPLETCTDETSLYPLFGCYLWMTEGEKIGRTHFSGFLETAYPRTPALLGYFLNKKIELDSGWIKEAFFFEKISLYRDLILFYRCLNNSAKVKFFQEQLRKEKKSISRP